MVPGRKRLIAAPRSMEIGVNSHLSFTPIVNAAPFEVNVAACDVPYVERVARFVDRLCGPIPSSTPDHPARTRIPLGHASTSDA
jgi:hypothetical protein